MYLTDYFLKNLLVAKISDQLKNKINYLGCYMDSGERLMEARLPDDTCDNTNEACSQACWERGYKYSGTEYSHECFCANRLGRFPHRATKLSRPDSECNSHCTGNHTEKCGGVWRLSAYERGNTYESKYVTVFNLLKTILSAFGHNSRRT